MKDSTVKITEAALSAEEKRRMRKVFVSRLMVLLLMILPLAGFLTYIVYLAVMSIVEGKADVFSYAVPSGFLLLCLAARKYLYPYFRNLRRYPGARNKQIIETTILNIAVRCFKPAVPLFTLKTGYGTIDTAVDVVLFPDLGFRNMREGMKIHIHRVPGLRNELLRIAEAPREARPDTSSRCA